MDEDLKIYVVTHKDYPIVKDDLHLPLLVGAENNEDTYGFLCDNEGDNISYKNDQYCELTGLYWMWKNCKNDYIGLCHYRRYFAMGPLGTKGIITSERCMELLENHDVIVHKRSIGFTLYDVSAYMITKELLDESLDIFKRIYPDFSHDMDEVINSRQHYGHNMLIAKKEIFDGYCEWLFKYLEVLEDELDTENLRIFGYISEICLSVYIRHHNLDAGNCPVDFVEAKSSIIANIIDDSVFVSYLFVIYRRLYDKFIGD